MAEDIICFSGYILGACYILMCVSVERIFNSEELNGLLNQLFMDIDPKMSCRI